MNVALRPSTAPALSPWWQDGQMLSLVRKSAFKDCNEVEFDEAVAVSRELNLSPLRKQIYAFVFSKDDPARRNMVLVVGIDGGRAIAARTRNYRPDDQKPEWVFKEELKDATNPNGIEACTVGVYHRPTPNDPFVRITHTVYWEEFAPIINSAAEDDYKWEPTGENYPPGHKKAGKPKHKRVLREGAIVGERLDPKKDAWIRAGRNQIAKCAEMGALRKGWPEDLSRIYAEEETHRAHTLEDVDYADLTPSQAADAADTDKRVGRIGGPAILAIFAESGDLERVPHGQFADRVLAHTAKLAPGLVKAWMEKNGAALNEFWAHNKNDALELKKVLEARSNGSRSGDARAAAPATNSTPLAPDSEPGRRGGTLSKDELLIGIGKIGALSDCDPWAEKHRLDIEALSDADRREVERAFNSKSGALSRSSQSN